MYLCMKPLGMSQTPSVWELCEGPQTTQGDFMKLAWYGGLVKPLKEPRGLA